MRWWSWQSSPSSRVASLFALALAGIASTPAAATDAATLLAEIRALPGVVAAENPPSDSDISGTLHFTIVFEQPVDHSRPRGPVFHQRVTLLHRDEGAPMVLQLEGYGSTLGQVQGELAYLLQANQLRVEHRFFYGSAPEGLPWSELTIAQAAADDHRIVEAFKLLYTGKWVSTGASKGGMASVYHRYFYPDDVDATVPYVAPSSHGLADPRYTKFLAKVGPASCRARLRTFVGAALARREELMALNPDDGFTIFNEAKAVEFAALELPFYFWQYRDETLCAAVPPEDAPAEQMYEFLQAVSPVQTFADSVLEYYTPYYFQAATELGSPRVDSTGYRKLLLYPGEDVPQLYPPWEVDKPFASKLMLRIERWVKRSGSRFLFIYGANDPWSTGAFAVNAKNDSYRLYVRGLAGNHGSIISDLSVADRALVLGKLERWLASSDIGAAFSRSVTARGQPAFDRPTRAELFLR